MPQELRIVKCYKCVTYQVDIVKKAKKWSCKMCGEKQTFKQEFGRGSGTECRKLVQELNMKKHEFEQMAHDVVQKIVNEEIGVPDFLLKQIRPEDGIPEAETIKCNHLKSSSKWETFIEPSEEESDSENLLEPYESKLNTSFKLKRVYKRKSYTLPESIEPQEKHPEDLALSQTSNFSNFNKKCKFQFDDASLLQDAKPKPENDKPFIRATKPKLLNPNSKWGNFLNNSDEETE